ncbi:MAG: Mov34/MPN/PAD-1 family protein [Promethearchaeota archaeon]
MPTCEFCDSSVNLTFLCKKCNKNYCYKHRLTTDHNCSRINKVNTSDVKPVPTYTPFLAPIQEKPSNFELILPKNGKIILDINDVSESVNKLIQYYKEVNDDCIDQDELELKEFILSDIRGSKLIKRMRFMRKHQLIEGVWFWLNILGDPLKVMKKLNKKHKIPFKEMTIQKIIELYHSYLYDFSTFIEKSYIISGFRNFTYLIHDVRNKIIARNNIIFNIKVLTDISEHARQSGDRECNGYLIGTRDSNNLIQEITQYEPLMLGDKRVSSFDTQSLVKVMMELEDTKKTIVGFVHSHPYKSVPAYSESDKDAHLVLNAVLSIFEYFSKLKISLGRDQLLKLSVYMTQFNYFQLKYLLEVISAIVPISSGFKEVLSEISRQNADTWSILEENIKIILNKYQIKIEPILFYMLHQAGVVICPWTRYIGIIDAWYDPNPISYYPPVIKWEYYTIKIKQRK